MIWPFVSISYKGSNSVFQDNLLSRDIILIWRIFIQATVPFTVGGKGKESKSGTI